ncbi:xanthine dehydrogenase [Halobacteriales archaeon QS_8_69_26]|nr:MAG: xanthine dehydrogenase [Halobacteriales archaeon QS_8_69_26]
MPSPNPPDDPADDATESDPEATDAPDESDPEAIDAPDESDPDAPAGSDPDEEAPSEGDPGGPTSETVEAAERRLRAAGDPFVRATVVRREPPISATVGSRAVVTGDGELIGWIGGVECARSTVIEEATAALAAGEPKLIGLAPDPAAVDRPGMEAFRLTCHSGGTVEIFLEPVAPGPELLVVGGSPIAATLAELAPTVGFAVTVVDPDAGAEDYPSARRVLTDADPDAVRTAVGDGAYAVVASVGEFDARGVAAAVGLPAPYVGLVASEQRALEVGGTAADVLGVDPETVQEAVTSPTGVEVGAETPEEIAVSILAELVAVRRQGPDDATDLAADLEVPDGSEEVEAGGDESEAGRAVATDPVCGMEVATADPAATVDHDGGTYYFCSEGCAEAFEQRPEEFLTTT